MKKKVLEKVVERYLVERVQDIGGKAYKFSSPNNRAVPDRICVFPYALFAFVECKSSDGKPTPLQNRVISYIRSLQHVVLVINSKEQVDLFIENTKVEIQRRKEMTK